MHHIKMKKEMKKFRSLNLKEKQALLNNEIASIKIDIDNFVLNSTVSF